jgi:hypothetical protein
METGHLEDDKAAIDAMKKRYLDEKFLSIICRYRHMTIKNELDTITDKDFNDID